MNGKLRDECLNLHWFRSLRHAREQISAWRRHYNAVRPHSALGYLSPMEFLTITAAPSLGLLRAPRRRSSPNPIRRIPVHLGPDPGERSGKGQRVAKSGNQAISLNSHSARLMCSLAIARFR